MKAILVARVKVWWVKLCSTTFVLLISYMIDMQYMVTMM